MTDWADITSVTAELWLAIVGMALLMFGVFRGDKSTKTVIGLAMAAFLVAFAIVWTMDDARITSFGGLFIVDRFGLYMKALVLLGSLATLFLSVGYLERERMYRFEYPVLIVFASLGMLMMVSANDLMSLYLGLELQSLTLYVVAAFQRDSLRSTEAGLKYFVLGALASGMLLYGCSMIYGFSGTTRFDALSALFSHGGHVSTGIVVGIVFLTAGLAFKISAVPFHMWTPDVYEGAPTPVTAFFSVAPKIAAVALVLRVFVYPFGDLVGQWQQIIIVISIGSMLLGAFAALAQTNIKRLMAYSSIGHIGYALIGLAAGTEAGVQSVLIYMLTYLFMNVGAFACILAMRRQGRMVEGIADLAGLVKSNPTMAYALTAFMFGMAGIPVFAGFFGKLYVFLAAIEAQLYALAVIGVLASVVGAYYYLRIVKLMMFDDPAQPFDRPAGREITSVAAVACVFTVFFFAFQSPFISGAEAAAESLFP